MPRKKRSWQKNMCHHVMLRGIDGRNIFGDDGDRSRFCLLLQEASELHSFRIHGFCLMSNHVHFIIEPVGDRLSTGVHRFAGRYAQYFNKKYDKNGYVFQGRFRSILVQDGVYLRRLLRYIHLNPLEASLTRSAEEYRWSSHGAYFGRAIFTWLETDRVLSYFGNNHRDALAKLAVFMNAKAQSHDGAEEIQRASRVGAYGSQEFTKIYAPETESSLLQSTHQIIDPKLKLTNALEAVCQRFDVSIEVLRSSDKRRCAVEARAVLTRTCQRMEGLSINDVCTLLGKHHGTLSRLASRAVSQPHLRHAVDELVQWLSKYVQSQSSIY